MKKTTLILTLFSSVTFAGGFNSKNVTFDKDIRPIFSKNCTKCHNGSNNLPNLLEYKVSFGLKDSILKRVSQERSMPYVGRITESERDLIEQWVESGAKK